MTVQAKNISDEQVRAAIAATRGRNGVPEWATRSDLQEHLAQFPPKVVLAKLRSMIKRKVINGCACGCRGDFELPPRSDAGPSRRIDKI